MVQHIKQECVHQIYHDMTFAQDWINTVPRRNIQTSPLLITYIASIDYYKNHITIINLFKECQRFLHTVQYCAGLRTRSWRRIGRSITYLLRCWRRLISRKKVRAHAGGVGGLNVWSASNCVCKMGAFGINATCNLHWVSGALGELSLIANYSSNNIS